jgi:hypothetical protein
MTQTPSRGPVIEVKPQPNVYTVLLIVAIMALAVAIGVVLRRLMAEVPTGYGLQFGQIFKGGYLPGG